MKRALVLGAVVLLLVIPAIRTGLVIARKQRSVLRGHVGPVYAVVFAPDRSFVASAGEDGVIRKWDAVGGHICGELRAHTARVRTLAVAADSTLIASGSDDGSLVLWDAAAGALRRRFDLRSLGFGQATPTALAFSKDNRLLAAVVKQVDLDHGIRGGDLVILAVTAEAPVRRISASPQYSSYHDVAFMPDHQTIAATTGTGVTLIDAATGQERAAFPAARSGAFVLAISDDGTQIATNQGRPDAPMAGRTAEDVALYQSHTGQVVRRFEKHDESVRSLAFAAGSMILASASWDGSVKLWDVSSGRELASLRGHVGRINCVAFASDGRSLASGGDDGVVRLWSLQEVTNP